MAQKIEGGSGGKRGHSQMDHWDYTDVIKKRSKKLRRSSSKKMVKKEIDNVRNDKE